MSQALARIFSLLFILFCMSCGGSLDTRGSVLGYRNGLVETQGGSFRVGVPSSDWVKKDFPYRALLFVHRTQNLSMGVMSFCKSAADEAPLKILTNQLFYGYTEQKTLNSHLIRLDGRDALRTLLSGKLDGVDVYLDVVVLKMNECVFDFFYTAKPEHYSAGAQDFVNLYQGFQYIKGPRI